MTIRPLLCVSFGVFPDEVREHLQQSGWAVTYVTNVPAAAKALPSDSHGSGLLYIDRFTPAQCEQLEALLRSSREREWVGVFSKAAQQVPGCADLILGYLFDHHTLPVDPSRLLQTLGHAYGRASMALSGAGPTAPAASRDAPTHILGHAPAMKALMRQICRVAATDAPVLIAGESGSGKELAAHAIHDLSRRRAAPFIAVNCGAIAAPLIQSELFGAVRGAYTNAAHDRKGLLEAADRGTIFLDEIGDLPLDLQINLLRFLQEKTITPVGASASTKLDVRVLAATNINLQLAVQQGRFRADLFYRLNVVPLEVPPLSEHLEDIPLLAQHFFDRYALERATRLHGFSHAALRAMLSHDWPGNVRELINRIRRAVVMAEGRLVTPADLGLEAHTAPVTDPLDQIRNETDLSALRMALARTNGNVTRAARELGISRMTVYRMVERHRINLAATKTEPHTPA